ncbi:MAG: DHHW family protein [Culicoidibacterales bacterium]
MNEQQAKRAVLLLVACFLTFGLWFTFQPKQQFFAYENRYLQRFPELSWQTLSDGRFTRAFETYVTDHFPARKLWLQLKGTSEWLLGKAENNGVYFGTNNWLFETWNLNNSHWKANVSQLATFGTWAHEQLPATQLNLLLVPTSSQLYSESLPWFAANDTQAHLLSELTPALPDWNVTDTLSTLYPYRDQALYFQTDHHWTQLGAFYAYQQLAESLDFQAHPFDFWQWETVSTSFTGSYYAKASVPFYSADAIRAAKSPTQLDYVNLETGLSEPLYSQRYLSQNDQYGYFLNGTPAFTQIQNPTQQNGKHLVMIKDSYAHVLAPLLAEHYERVTVIDLRFFNQSLRAYLQAEQVDQLLFIAGATTFNTDMQLGKLQR